MKLEDISCPCGAPVKPLQDDAGVFLECSEGCGAVTADPAPSVAAAIEAWLAAMPAPTIEDALGAYAYHASSALLRAQSPEMLVALAPVAQVLISYLQVQSLRPGGEPTST